MGIPPETRGDDPSAPSHEDVTDKQERGRCRFGVTSASTHVCAACVRGAAASRRAAQCASASCSLLHAVWVSASDAGGRRFLLRERDEEEEGPCGCRASPLC